MAPFCGSTRWGGAFVRDGVLYDYGIPPSNPFAGMPGALGEIFAYGFRNAHRLSWDRDGTLLVSDIGEAQIEELDLVVAGGNYGWPEREGSFSIDVETNPNVVFPLPPEDPLPYRYPVAQYDHAEGRAIAGGFVYRGRRSPSFGANLSSVTSPPVEYSTWNSTRCVRRMTATRPPPHRSMSSAF